MSKRRKGKSPRPGPSDVNSADSTGTADGDLSSDVSMEAPLPRTTFDGFRENIEALVVAVLLAVIIRHFAVEAFEIPTGSMAPTLYGMHAWVESPNCEHRFPVGLPSDPRTGAVSVRYRRMVVYEGSCGNTRCGLTLHGSAPRRRDIVRGGAIECQACGTEFTGDASGYRETEAWKERVRCPLTHITWEAVFERSNLTNGHKILVNKFVYSLGNPKRFDVVVFGFDQWKNYIKRLVGLPGESIWIHDGDIYTSTAGSPFEIVRKSRDHASVQETLWTLISDSTCTERGLAPTPAWVEPDQGRSRVWERLNDGRFSVNPLDDKTPAVLEFRRPIDSYSPYNLLQPGNRLDGLEQVGDLRLDLQVRPARAGGWIGAEIRDDEFTFQVRIPVGRPDPGRSAVIERVVPQDPNDPANPLRAAVTGAGALRKELANVALAAETDSLVRIENCDDTVRVLVDGKLLLELEYTSVPASLAGPGGRPPTASDGPHYLWVLASGGGANLQSLRVYRDLYYLSRRVPSLESPRYTSIELGENEYFVLGDNSASSSDGRFWGHVPDANLMGKALLVFWPAWPDNFQCKFIR